MKRRMMMLFCLLALSLTALNGQASAAPVMWGKTELKKGQLGKVTVMKEVMLFQLKKSYIEPVRMLKPGEEFRVYNTKTIRFIPLYGLGGSMYVIQNDRNNSDSYIKYETPSKRKLALLNNASQSPVMWGSMELKKGQVGRVTTVESGFSIYKYEDGKMVPARYVEKGETFRVYGIVKDANTTNYALGGNLYAYRSSIRKDGSEYMQKNLKYETPSKEKLDLVNQ